MQRQTTHTITVPAGMRLNFPITSNRRKVRDNHMKSSDSEFSDDKTRKQKFVPPKTLSKNKRISASDFQVKSDGVFSSEIRGFVDFSNNQDRPRVSQNSKSSYENETVTDRKSPTEKYGHNFQPNGAISQSTSYHKNDSENTSNLYNNNNCKNGLLPKTKDHEDKPMCSTTDGGSVLSTPDKKSSNIDEGTVHNKSNFKGGLVSSTGAIPKTPDTQCNSVLKTPEVKINCRTRLLESIRKSKEKKKLQQNTDGELKKYVEKDSTKSDCKSPNEQVGRGLPFLKKTDLDKPIKMETKIDNRIILQGQIIPKQKFALDETCIDTNIQAMLSNMEITSAKQMQSYLWPATQRGLSVFVIGPHGSGKTMSYLPIFITFCVEKNDRYRNLPQCGGPLVIILCPNNESCYELHNLTKTLISRCPTVTVDVLTEGSQVDNCDILITTPSSLDHCVQQKQVDLGSLYHLAIENAHITLSNHTKSLESLFGALNSMQLSRPSHKTIQLVISSEKWSIDLESLLKHLYLLPLVCFEDFLEAAVYSKVEFRKKKLKSVHKIFYLKDILKANYMSTKSVVFCEEEEMAKIKEYLEINGVECISISNNLSEDEMFGNEETWSSLRSGQYKVLLCTDLTYEKTAHVMNAKWLVHYALPEDLNHFQKRFRCFSKNIRSPLNVQNDDTIPAASMFNFMIIDEGGNSQLCLNFFEVLLRNSIKRIQL